MSPRQQKPQLGKSSGVLGALSLQSCCVPAMVTCRMWDAGHQQSPSLQMALAGLDRGTRSSSMAVGRPETLLHVLAVKASRELHYSVAMKHAGFTAGICKSSVSSHTILLSFLVNNMERLMVSTPKCEDEMN